jgi:ribonuclease VapC
VIVDTSALMAVLCGEEEAESFSRAIAEAEVTRLSAASYLEAAMVVERLADAKRKAMFEDVLELFGIEVEAVTLEQARVASEAFRRFGKGRHPAGLNFGDCFTYALAKVMREPVLYKGSDFSQTDLVRAVEGEQAR